jgi:hypothetical protein
MRHTIHTKSKLGPKCERCGIPLMTSTKVKCDACAAQDKEIAERIASGWTGDDDARQA